MEDKSIEHPKSSDRQKSLSIAVAALVVGLASVTALAWAQLDPARIARQLSEAIGAELGQVVTMHGEPTVSFANGLGLSIPRLATSDGAVEIEAIEARLDPLSLFDETTRITELALGGVSLSQNALAGGRRALMAIPATVVSVADVTLTAHPLTLKHLEVRDIGDGAKALQFIGDLHGAAIEGRGQFTQGALELTGEFRGLRFDVVAPIEPNLPFRVKGSGRWAGHDLTFQASLRTGERIDVDQLSASWGAQRLRSGRLSLDRLAPPHELTGTLEFDQVDLNEIGRAHV